MFRYENPQEGRQRQFQQIGAEVYGVAGPVIEAELILMLAELWQRLGLADAAQLELNTLGTAEDRANYRAALVAYFEQHSDQLDADSQRRLSRNPLRILDTKNPAMAELVENAPKLHDRLSDASMQHFESVKALVTAAGIRVRVNPRLVRGLDYYSHTVFEWTTDRLGAQSAICGGGRYDAMLTDFGAKNTPGVGWAFGMERVVALLTKVLADSGESVPAASPDAFVICTVKNETQVPLMVTEQLRRACPDLRIVQNVGSANLSNQLKRADKLGARCAVLLGDTEHGVRRAENTAVG